MPQWVKVIGKWTGYLVLGALALLAFKENDITRKIKVQAYVIMNASKLAKEPQMNALKFQNNSYYINTYSFTRTATGLLAL